MQPVAIWGIYLRKWLLIMDENNLVSRLVMKKNNGLRIKSILVMVLAFISQDKITFSVIPVCQLFSEWENLIQYHNEFCE